SARACERAPPSGGGALIPQPRPESLMFRRLAAIGTVKLWGGLAALLVVGLAGWGFLGRGERSSGPASAVAQEEVAEAPLEAVRDFCSKCHAYPPPDSFP